MNMDNRFLFAVLLLVVPVAISKVLTPENEAALVAEVNARSPRALLYLGMVDGKGFFVDNSTNMSWTASRSFCISAGLRLAEITSSAQHNFLQEKLHRATAITRCWTGARDSRTAAQFIWEGSAANVTSYGGNFLGGAPIATAVLFRVPSSGPAFLEGVAVTYACYVLCEAV